MYLVILKVKFITKLQYLRDTTKDFKHQLAKYISASTLKRQLFTVKTWHFFPGKLAKETTTSNMMETNHRNDDWPDKTNFKGQGTLKCENCLWIVPSARARKLLPRGLMPQPEAPITEVGTLTQKDKRKPILQTNTPVYEDAKGEGLHDGESCLS